MRILGIIPARGGSKGVPGKNIRTLAGLPLLAYTAFAANQSSLLTETILSSDDKEIINVGKNFKINSPFIRPTELGTDTSTSLQVIQHAVQYFYEQKIFFDAVCLLQPTSPFRVNKLIDTCINKFIGKDADTLFTVVRVPHQYNPYWCFEKNENDFLNLVIDKNEIIPQRQQLPETFVRDGSVYLIKTDLIMQQNTLYGNKIAYVETDVKWFMNIDTPDDWQLAEKKALEYQQTFLKNREELKHANT